MVREAKQQFKMAAKLHCSYDGWANKEAGKYEQLRVN